MNGRARQALGLVLLGGSLALAGCGSSRANERLFPGTYRGDRVVTGKGKPAKEVGEKKQNRGKQKEKKQQNGRKNGKRNKP